MQLGQGHGERAEELVSRSSMLCSEVCLILEMTMKGVVFWFRLDIQGLGARRDFFCQSINAKKFAQADQSRSFIRSVLEMLSISLAL